MAAGGLIKVSPQGKIRNWRLLSDGRLGDVFEGKEGNDLLRIDEGLGD